MTSDDNKVLIIGAGLAGLVVAHSCQTQGIPYQIFERDFSPDAREQGFSITLHMALKPLKEFVTYPGAHDDFGKKVSVNTSEPESISMAMLDGQTEEVYFKSNPSQFGEAYRVNRKRFREWLLKGIDQDNIHWNKRLSHYESKRDGVTVYFADGSSFLGRVLVGADGVLSPVCTQLVGGKTKFEEITSINPTKAFAGIRWITKEEWNTFSKYSSCIGIVFGQRKEGGDIEDDQTNLFYSINDIDMSREDGKHIQILWYISRYDINNKIPIQFKDDEECLEMLKTWTKNSFKDGAAFQKLILESSTKDTKILHVTIRERTPVSELIENDQRVLLVGDAAHCMTMFRGEGGNHAIVDAGLLGTQLGKYYSGEISLEKAHKTYYDEMIPRGSKAVKDSHEAVDTFLVHREKMITLLQELDKKINGK